LDFQAFSYANPAQPRIKRWLIRSVEGLSGRNRYYSIYDVWRREVAPGGQRVFSKMLEMTGIRLEVSGIWPPMDMPQGPTVMIANHPFGIGDGIAILSLAEQLGRPFRVLINSELMKIDEIEPYALPICFDETKEAVALNLKTRQEALRLIRQGCTIVVFPAGGVATAPKGFGKAEDLPWKLFTARLVQSAQASVIPLQFFGQNGRLFHLVSKVSLTLRLSLLVREFKRLNGKTLPVRIGQVLDWEELAGISDRKALLKRLYDAVFAGTPPISMPKRRGAFERLRRRTVH
jgi:putative hemolysin